MFAKSLERRLKMGKEAEAKKKLQEIGKYNVRISLLFMGPDGRMMMEAIPCKTWQQVQNYLALTLFDGTLRVVCLDQYHGFSVSELDMDEFKSDGEKEN